MIIYTSGTTGNPKGVLYSHRSTLLHTYAAALPDALNCSARDVILPVVPMFHVNAWGLPYAACMVGAKMVYPGAALDGKSLYELFESGVISYEEALELLQSRTASLPPRTVPMPVLVMLALLIANTGVIISEFVGA